MGLPRGALRHCFFVLAMVGVVGLVVRWVGPFTGLSLRLVAIVKTVYYLALAGALAAKLAWVHAAWKALPPGCRVTALGLWVTPDEAAWKHLIPWRALTWQFTAHVGVAEATNAVLASYATGRRTSTRMPFFACACLFLPGVNLLLTPGLLYAHMESVDRAQAEMARCLENERAARPWVPAQRPTLLSLVTPLVVASLLFWVGVPLLLLRLAASGASGAKPATPEDLAKYGAVKTPEHVELHSDRIAEAMVACGRESGMRIPKTIEECPAARAAVLEAHRAGGASYAYAHGELIAWRLDAHRVYAKRHLHCDKQRGCSYSREKYGL